jgi:peptide/nickel transport system permease protein
MLVAACLVFVATNILPGDPARAVAGENAGPEVIASAHEALGLNRPLLDRLGEFLGGLLTGNFGESSAALVQGAHLPVTAVIGTPLRNTMVLAALTFVVFVPLCLALAAFGAIRSGRRSERALSAGLLAVAALPEFLVGTLLIGVFFAALNLLPPLATVPEPGGPLANLPGLILPVLTLLALCVANGYRLVRASTQTTLGEPYVEWARLNGIADRTITWRYVIRNSLAPGVQAAAEVARYLFGGVIVVETVFSYPGIGLALVRSISLHDFQLTSAIVAVLAGLYILINLTSDLTVAWLVPRLRTGGVA